MPESMSAKSLQQPPPPPKAPPSRALPAAVEAERSILSTMLQNPDDFVGQAVEAGLLPGDFSVPAHRALFRTVVERQDDGAPIDLVSLTQVLEDRGSLKNIGGPHGLTSLWVYSPTAAHFTHHLALVRDKSLLRASIKACTDGISDAYDDPEDVRAYLDGVERRVLAVRSRKEVQGEIPASAHLPALYRKIREYVEGKRARDGLPTGYPDLDAMSGGLKPGEVFVIAARPSMGKTALMLNIVEHLAFDQKLPLLVFSCEMSSLQLVERLLVARSRFPIAKLAAGFRPTKDDLRRIESAGSDIEGAKLFIDDTPNILIGELRAKARRKHRDPGVRLIAVDYLQLLRSKSRHADSSREREVSEISMGLKGLAKELNIPVLVLAQLNRAPDARGGVPRMSDLRESGSIEQDADLVGLLYREEYYADDQEQRRESSGKAELVLAKNRNGATGPVPLTFLKEIMRFESRASEE